MSSFHLGLFHKLACLLLVVLPSVRVAADDAPLPPIGHLPGMDICPEVIRVHVDRFVFEGNTVFSDAELAKVAAPWTGRELGVTIWVSNKSVADCSMTLQMLGHDCALHGQPCLDQSPLNNLTSNGNC